MGTDYIDVLQRISLNKRIFNIIERYRDMCPHARNVFDYGITKYMKEAKKNVVGEKECFRLIDVFDGLFYQMYYLFYR